MSTVTNIVLPAEFADDPIAPHSAQFPLGRSEGDSSFELSVQSDPQVRPWGLRGMHMARAQHDPVRELFKYDHRTQTALDPDGRSLVAEAPTAESVTNNDGDEGASEDWKYDFCPDHPFQI